MQTVIRAALACVLSLSFLAVLSPAHAPNARAQETAVGASPIASPIGSPQAGEVFQIHATFQSELLQDGTADCPTPPYYLVRGTGTGSGTHFTDAAASAEECSLPTIGRNGEPIFDVRGKGTFTTDDGSVLRLIYNQTSENPFALGPPPWELHDSGHWVVDGARSTGRFLGATGEGTMSAVVPITCDAQFNCLASVTADYVGTISFASAGQ